MQAPLSGVDSPQSTGVTGYRIGDLVVHLGRALTTRGDGVEIPLPRLSFDLLVALARAAPNIATQDDLMKQVWPRAFVSPETLSKRVNLLRDALGDDSQEPRYIAGVRGRGYRLVPNVEQIHASSAPPEASTPPERHRARPRRIAVMLAVGGVLVLGAGWALWTRSHLPVQLSPVAAEPPPRSIAVLPFKDMGGGPDGEILALGIPEAVLHQLASIETLDVIARTSSFSFQGHDQDVRAIGEQLNVRYILEGSVQRDGQRLRVTTQLVNAQTGGHVWSMQFDKAPQGIFELQDAIALEVARALKLSLDPGVTLKQQGTKQFDAYLEYIQGAKLLATWRTADTKSAAEHAARAVSIDPNFAAAYVLLANARLRIAEYSAGETREFIFREALRDARGLLDQALTLDAKDSRAYAVRGYVNAFSDVAAAEADYRKALELNPSDAQACEGLAGVLNENPARRAEVLMLIDRARKLDPLEPRLDVVKATFLFYTRGDLDGAEKLLKNALQRDPLNEPALSRLAEVYWKQGRYAEGIKTAEQVVAADSDAIQPRTVLYYLYLDIQDLKSAENIARAAPSPSPALMAALYLAQKKWVEAGNQTLRAESIGAITAVGEPITIAALRMNARATKQYARAIDLLTERSQTEWDVAGQPIVRDSSSVYSNVVGLGDMLIQAGQVNRGRRLLEATLTAMDREEATFGTGRLWNYPMRLVALGLLGRTEATIAELQRSMTERLILSSWYFLELEPAFANVRQDSRFQEVLVAARNRAAGERKALARFVANGLVPDRTKPR
ncbi:MAG: tetratricopeptide repeat protein [Gammaproteobacteria bacterium]